MSRADITQASLTVAKLMVTRLGARGDGLSQVLRHSGRLLPRRVRRAARVIEKAQRDAGHPAIARQIDEKAIARALETCRTYLTGLDASARRRRVWIDALASLAFNLLILAAACAGYLVWRAHGA